MRLPAHHKETELQSIPGALLRPTKKRCTNAVRTLPEAQTQDLTEKYLNLLGYPWLHIPEFILAMAFRRQHLSGPELGAARWAADMIRGFPDLVVFHAGRYLAIELKTEVGKMTHAQLAWQKRLGTCLCRNFEEAKTVIDIWSKTP